MSILSVQGSLKTIAESENVIIRRGDIYYADLRPVVGSEQGGVRPVLVIQNDIGNKHSPTVICAAITSKMNKAKLPTHVELNARQCAVGRTAADLRLDVDESGQQCYITIETCR